MFSNRKILLFIFSAATPAVILFPLLRCNNYPGAAYHKFLHTEEFKNISRSEQTKKCAECHKKEYENEMMGPHAAAFKNLSAHKEFVNSNKYDCGFYTQHVNEAFPACLGCHTPQNLFETLLKDSLNEPLKLAEKLLNDPHPRPLTRQNETERGNSIDCMSCHYDGAQMVSLKQKWSADDSIAEKQTLQQITVNNLNCFLCHADVVRTFNAQIAITQTGSARCVNCHVEKDKTGKGTHYFFWQHDAAGKQNPKPEKLLTDFHFSVSADKKSGNIVWKNTQMPHKISPGPEMVLFCDVLDKDLNILGQKTIRINKKKEFDEEMYANMGNNYHRGVAGDDVPLNGEEKKYSFPLKNPAAACFRISFMHKSQYWFPDSLGKINLVKTYTAK